MARFTSNPKFSGYEDITPQHPGILLEATGQLKTPYTTSPQSMLLTPELLPPPPLILLNS